MSLFINVSELIPSPHFSIHFLTGKLIDFYDLKIAGFY